METAASVTVKLSGEFDFSNKDELSRALSAAERSDVAVIDMTNVRFMDSSAISCLISLKKAMVLGGRLGIVRLTHVNPQIERIFRICGLERIFDLESA